MLQLIGFEGAEVRVDAKVKLRPSISMGMLKRSGLFDKQDDSRVGFIFGSLQVVVQVVHDRERIAISWKDGKDFFRQFVGLCNDNTSLGRRDYFRCRASGNRCRRLFLIEGRFVSRNGDDLVTGQRDSPKQRRYSALHRDLQRLWGLDGRGPARGANREKLLARIPRSGWMRIAAPQAADALDIEHEKQDRKKRRLLRSSRPISLLTAEAGFSGGSPVRISDDNRDWPKLLDAEGRIRRPGVRPLALASNEAFPVLTIRAMARKGMLRDGHVSAHTLAWPGYEELILECHLEIEGHAFLLIRPRSRGGFQIITLSAARSGGRRYMHCPFARTKHDTLYYREGLFGSAVANRLVHASQRKAVDSPFLR